MSTRPTIPADRYVIFAIGAFCATLLATAFVQAREKSTHDVYESNLTGITRRLQHDIRLTPRNGNPDHDFAVSMVAQQIGALDQAELYLKHGSDPELLELAKKMVDARKAELEILRRNLGSSPSWTPEMNELTAPLSQASARPLEIRR